MPNNMHIINRPEIDMKISTWEIMLSSIHLLFLLVLIYYYHKQWNSIPTVIPGLSYREGAKTSFFGSRIYGAFLIVSASIYTILLLPPSKYFNGKSVSKKLHKAKMQYRVETSWWLCLSIAIHLFFLAENIVYVEAYIKKNHISIHWWPYFFIVAGIVWLIHHILWTRLSDK
jgi:hypothetical protein